MFVYFVQEDRTGNYKIGKADNVDKRVAQLQSGNSNKLILLLKVQGGYPLEKSLHKRFAKYRIRGEWFKPNAEIEAYIELNQLNVSIHISDDLSNPICAICARKLNDNDLVKGHIKKSISAFSCQIEPKTYMFCCVEDNQCELKTSQIMDDLYFRDWGWHHIGHIRKS